MKVLGAIQPAHGISAMQSINVAVINPSFLMPFFGMAAMCVLLIIAAFLRWHEPGAAYVLAGGLLYFLGTFLVTMLFNVPRTTRWQRLLRPALKGLRCGRTILSSGRSESRSNNRGTRGRRLIHDRAHALAAAHSLGDCLVILFI
jgi:hypothetical protein